MGNCIALAIAAVVLAASAAATTSCLGDKSCTYDGAVYSSGTTWKCDCNLCGCSDGVVSSTSANCGPFPSPSPDAAAAQDGSPDAEEGSFGDAGLDGPQGS